MHAAVLSPGHKQAAALASLSNISVTLVPESAVYAIMSRVNKVIFSVSVL
jgi:translation initiation factor 2B subunit (eIF-2B alpha/beta/delta family)